MFSCTSFFMFKMIGTEFLACPSTWVIPLWIVAIAHSHQYSTCLSELCYPAVHMIPRVSQVVLVVKNLLANTRDMRPFILSLAGKDDLEKGMATHSSILANRTPWTEEPGGLQSMGLQRVGHN